MRRRDPQRLPTIAAAALTVFSRRGFVQAQMSEVAAEAGVSVGTLYNHVENKEALLLVSVLSAFGDLDAAELPYRVADRATMVEQLRAAVRREVRIPTLDAQDPLLRPSRREAQRVIGELYDLLSATRHVADAFERCAAEAPDLAEVFYVEARGRLLQQLTQYLDRYAPRHGATGVVPAAGVARHIVETVTWLARHRHHDQTWTIDDAQARQLAIDLLTSAQFGTRR